MKLKNISKSYNSKIILDKINYSLQDNKIYSLFGINGVGKTTLLNIINGNIEPDHGEIVTSKRMMFIPNNKIPFQYMTGIEFIEMTLKLKRITYEKKDLDSMIDQFRLSDQINSFIIDYSQGMKYKLLIIIAIFDDSQLLLLDEPFNELDLITREQIKIIFSKIKKRKTILFSTHNPEISFMYSDVILFLESNKLIDNDNTFETSKHLETYIKQKMQDDIS